MRNNEITFRCQMTMTRSVKDKEIESKQSLIHKQEYTGKHALKPHNNQQQTEQNEYLYTQN